MCVIIAKPKGVDPLNKEYFENAWNHNSHGGGVCWKTPEGEVMMQKGFMDKKEFLDKLDEINQKDNSFIAHFRIKSVGEVKPENTHPFVMDHVTFAHNGTISSLKPIEGKTDSETFGLCFLKNRSMKWIKENALLLELALGTSKFAIMDNKTGEIFVLNKEYGQEKDGAWFSNSSAFPYTPPKQTNFSSYAGYYNSMYSGYSSSPTTVNDIKANKLFGTKGFTYPYAEYDADKKCFVYTSTKTPVYCAYLNAKFVINRRGFWQITKDLEIPKEFLDMPSELRRPTNRALGIFTSHMNKLLREYYRGTYDSSIDRSEAEQEISALHTVLDICRRLIKAGKAVTEDAFDQLVFRYLTVANYGKSPYATFVSGYVEELLDTLYPERLDMSLAV